MPDKYIFTLPEKISTNEIYAGKHWTVRSNHKKLFRSILSVYFKHIKKPKTPCRIFFEFNFKKRPLDASNCSYLAKLIEDSLVHSGIIPDDSWKYVKGISIDSLKTDKEDFVKLWFE